ncbi:MAG: SpoIIE family protein phosphatase [Spirochaetes bacterium]|nr:SpoIIE family protein phosphatase [Spirochaetota bacterium]
MNNTQDIRILSKENETLHKITEITKTINSTLDIAKLLNTIMESIKNILDAEASSLLFYDEDTDELVFKIALGGAGEKLTEKYRIKSETGIIGWVAKNKKTLIVNDVYSDKRFNPQFDKITGFKTNAIIASPLLFKGKLLGVIEGINPIEKECFDESDQHLFELFADQAVMAVQNAIIFEKAIFNKRIESELQKSIEVQRKILAPVSKKINNMELSAKNINAKDLSGEFFQIYENDEYISFALGDIHKAGIPGAITASALTGAVDALSLVYGNKPLTMLKYFSRYIGGYVNLFNEISFFYGTYNPSDKYLEFVNTGFTYPVLIRDNKAHYLKFNSHTFKSSNDESAPLPSKVKIKIKKNDIFIVMTDGIINLKNRKNQLLGLKKIMTLIEQSDSGITTGRIISILEKEIQEFLEDMELRDDITILCLKNI